MSFRDRPFKSRFTKMGDEAEGVFEATYPEGWTRFGLNRPPINLKDVPPFIRYTPDYLTGKGLVEVQGFGRDQTFKLKDDKLAALMQWHGMFRADLFVYDSHNKRYGFVRLRDLQAALEAGRAERGAFDDGKKPYWAVRAEHLPVVEWLEAPVPTGESD